MTLLYSIATKGLPVALTFRMDSSVSMGHQQLVDFDWRVKVILSVF